VNLSILVLPMHHQIVDIVDDFITGQIAAYLKGKCEEISFKVSASKFSLFRQTSSTDTFNYSLYCSVGSLLAAFIVRLSLFL